MTPLYGLLVGVAMVVLWAIGYKQGYNAAAPKWECKTCGSRRFTTGCNSTCRECGLKWEPVLR